jgi:hypothetical protein
VALKVPIAGAIALAICAKRSFTVFDEIEAHRWCSFQCGDEGHIPQDPAIALLWIAFVHTREKGVQVASAPGIVE